MRPSNPEAELEPKFPKPKILLIDCPDEATALLLADGYNAVGGTFGRPYKVRKANELVPVVAKANLPNYTEQEIIIINLTPPDFADHPEAEKAVAAGHKDWWASCAQGYVDPRPRVMANVQDSFVRIFESGGIFVVFCEPRLRQEIFFGSANAFGLDRFAEAIRYDNWSFLSFLTDDFLTVSYEHGSEIHCVGSDDLLTPLLLRHLSGTTFEATLEANWQLTNTERLEFYPLLKNKYDSIVGAVILDKESHGIIICLPHLGEEAAFIHRLISTVLPDLAPRHFPYSERSKWLQAPEYEHPTVAALVSKRAGVMAEAETRIEQINSDISKQRERLGYLHGLLTETGDSLVADVKTALEALGFSEVVNVDENSEETAPKQEDLQIHDRSPSILAEVKGLAGLPREDDTLQIVKYIPRRMKEWERLDVSGICIVNHQRHLPPLDRNNQAVFTDQQIQDAEHHDIVLLTTWELFKLVRGFMEYGWPARAVQDLFYGRGRIPNVPAHYRRVGTVGHFYDKASVVSIDLESALQVGDRLGFCLPAGFVEEDVSSLEVDRSAVERAGAGQAVGYKTARRRSELKVGSPVYVVERQVEA